VPKGESWLGESKNYWARPGGLKKGKLEEGTGDLRGVGRQQYEGGSGEFFWLAGEGSIGYGGRAISEKNGGLGRGN